MRVLTITLFVAFVATGAVLAVSRVLGESRLAAGPPAWFGSRSEVIDQISAVGGDDYAFAVLGDIQQGLLTFREALALVSAEPRVRFAVACGDLVNHPDEDHYRLLFHAASRAGSRVPLLTVPGNHDNPVTYESLLGPRMWSVPVGPDLLIGVDNSEGPLSVDELQAVDRVLRTTSSRHVFAFLHRPLTGRDGAVRPRGRPLLDILVRGGVRGVFGGHRNDYHRIEIDGVLHLTTGRGGDVSGLLPTEASLALVEVGPDGIRDRRVSLGARSEIASHLVDTLVAHVYAPLRGTLFWPAGAILLLLVTLLVGFEAIGRPALVVCAAVFALAFASPPTAALSWTGWSVLSLGVVLCALPATTGRVGRWLAEAGVLISAGTLWIAVPTLLIALAEPRARARVLGRKPTRPLPFFFAALGALLLFVLFSRLA